MKCKRILVLLCLFTLTVSNPLTGQEENDALAIRAGFAQALDGHNPEEYMSFFAEDAVWDWVTQPAPLVGHDQIGAMFNAHISSSPDDWRTDQGRVMSVDNLVVVEHAALGTQTGALPTGGPPSGNEWVYPHLDIYEIEGDKIKRLTTYADTVGVFVQWGLMPAPEMPELIPSFTLPDAEPTGLTPLESVTESYARWNSKDLVHNAKMFHPDAEFFLAPLGVPVDKNAYTAMDELYLAAFSDRQAEILRTIDLGDGWVLAEVVFSGTHTGPYGGVPATGNPFRLRGASLQRFDADGLLTSHNVYYDNLTLMTQITAPTPSDLLAIQAASFEAMNAHDVNTLASYWTDDFFYDLVTWPAPVSKENMKTTSTNMFAYYPDFRMAEIRTLAGRNVVVGESVTLRTNPTLGIEIASPHLSIYDFEGDKIKRETVYKDNLSDNVQTGKMPAPVMPELVPSFTLPDAEPTGLSPMEANTEHVSRWNSHDAALVAKIYHADVQVYVGPLGTDVDRAALTAINEMYYAAFPDVELEVVRAIELLDGWVVTELISRATNLGPFMDIPAQGYPIEIKVVWLMRYNADGLVIEGSFYFDNMTLLNQITIAPWPLDGIWITSSPTPLGNWISKTVYVSQNGAKTQYSGTLEFVNAFPLFMDLYPDTDPSLTLSAGGQAVMVGRNKYEATYLQYDRKYDASTGIMEIVGIDTLKAYFEVVGPDQIQGHGTASYYIAAQDADQDGFPDEGEEPVACFPWEWTSKRLTALPGCTPAPIE
jgi:predicted ester cyclase/ketosteroid isomerase-like protein